MIVQHDGHEARNTGFARWVCIAFWTLLVAPVCSLLIGVVVGFVFGLVSPDAFMPILIPMVFTLPWIFMLAALVLGMYHKLPGT